MNGMLTFDQAIMPPLMTSSGFAPKFSGFHMTRSARQPIATCPTRCDTPWVIALASVILAYNKGAVATHGLIVYFAIYRLTRALSLLSESPSSVPRTSRILDAVRHVRDTTSPTRPMACESELIILIAPVSCRTSSAATVSARIRESAKAMSSGIDLSRWWHTMSI